MSTEHKYKDLTSNDAKPKLYDGQKVRANWDGKLGTVRKLYRAPFAFNESYQYYIDWDNGHWGIASESELSPVIGLVCTCEMPAKMKGKNQCWRCKKPFKEFLQTDR